MESLVTDAELIEGLESRGPGNTVTQEENYSMLYVGLFHVTIVFCWLHKVQIYRFEIVI